MRAADVRTSGWFTLQDHDPAKALEKRLTMGAVRVHAPDPENGLTPGVSPEGIGTYGDIRGGILWLSRDDQRKHLHSWWLSGPGVVFRNPPATSNVPIPGADGFSNVGDIRPLGKTVTAQEAQQGADSAGWFPIRYSGAELGADHNWDDRYQPKRFGLGDKAQAGGRQSGFPSWMPEGYAFPTGWTGQISSGSDEKGQYENLHPDAWALFSGGHSTLIFSVDGNYRPDKFGRLQSLTQVIDVPGAQGQERPLGLALDPFIGGPLRPEGMCLIGGNGIGFGSGLLGGPFVVPAASDFHNTAPGIGPLHLNVDANWISATVDSHDGPFDQTPGDTEGYRRKVNFGRARPNGANPNGETAGWGWEVFVPYFEDGEGEDRTESEGGKDAEGAGGGGGGGGGGGKPKKKPGGGTPPGGRTIVLTDDIIGLSPIGKPGVNLIGRPGGPVPAVAVQPPEPGSAPGRAPPVVGGLQKPKKLNIPQTIATTGLAIKATSQRAGEFDPSSSSAPMSSAQASLYEAAPTVALFAGYGQGDGSWGGFVNATHNTPQTAPTANGGVVVLPPGSDVRGFLAGTTVPTTTTTMVMAQGYTSLGFGKPVLSTGGASGVKMTGDAAGVKFTNHDSTGTLVAGADFRFGEAGFIINGKIDHNGRLDPWSVEFTDRSPEDIPNGAAGFFWSTDDTEFPGIDGYRPLWKRPDDNSIEEIAFKSDGSGLPTRHVSGLVIRYASSSTVTVSAGKCRDKADGADMTLSSQVTVDKTSANAALGYERKTLTGTHTLNFGAGTAVGSGSAYLTEFGTRALSAGTVTNATTTLTGTGTKFLSEVAVNDLIGNNASGYYRVTAVASDTSLTLINYPSGAGGPSTGVDFSGATVNVIEQPVIESAAGKAHGVSIIFTNTDIYLGFTTASATETGVAAYASSKSALDSTSYTCLWRAVWLLSGGSGTTVALSTQRTTPYLSITGYTTSYRRIGWVRIDSSGNVLPTYSTDGGGVRTVDYESNSSATEQSIASNLALTTSWQTLLAGASVPPTSRRVILAVQLVDPNTVGYTILRGRNLGNAGASVANYRACGPPTSTSTRVFNTVLVPCDGAQAIEVGSNANTGDGSYIAVLGYEDTLE